MKMDLLTNAAVVDDAKVCICQVQRQREVIDK
jgi:hypothetical protein